MTRVLRFISHSKRAARIAVKHGWLLGARYTNLRDIRHFRQLGFLDIDWKNYNFKMHLSAAQATRPLMTVARDVEDIDCLDEILNQAEQLSCYSQLVVIVPKDPRLSSLLNEAVPPQYLIGYSVPTKYGGTTIPPSAFNRPVHLLGGRPDVQRQLGDQMPVFSFDGNRFTLDAGYGDFFDGHKFRPHDVGGYDLCLEESVKNINEIWKGYNCVDSSKQMRSFQSKILM